MLLVGAASILQVYTSKRRRIAVCCQANTWLRKRGLYPAGKRLETSGKLSVASTDLSKRRFNVVAGEVQTFADMCRWVAWERLVFCKNFMTVTPALHPCAQDHPLFAHGHSLHGYWRTYCLPLEVTKDGSICIASRRTSLKRMWTRADVAHVHAISGAVYMLMGLIYLLAAVGADLSISRGSVDSQRLPTEVAVVSLGIGAVNAVSGMQPALLSHSLADFKRAMGLGRGGNLRSGGFINTCLFWCILAYQSIRVLPWFPTALQALDPLVGVASILAMAHSRLILDGFVQEKKLHQSDVSEIWVPGLLNFPVTLHLIFHGQAWIEQLSSRCPHWPDAFFTSNYALAWSSSAVTFVLSLFERGVVSRDQQRLLIVCVPLAALVVILLEVSILEPSEQRAMMTGFC